MNIGLSKHGFNLVAIIRRYYPETEFPPAKFPKLISTLTRYFNTKKQTGQQSDFAKIELANASLSPLSLLHESPHVLIDIYTPIIWRVIKKHCYNAECHEDMFQDVITEMLERRIKRMQERYTQEIPFLAYFIKVTMNCCRDIQRKHVASANEKAHDEFIENYAEATEETGIIDQELDVFTSVLQHLYNPKLMITFKVKHKVPVSASEFKHIYPFINKYDLKHVEKKFNPHKKPFEGLSKLFNKYERKQAKPDSLRRLLHLYLTDLSDQMNIKLQKKRYCQKTISALLLTYFEKQHQHVSSLLLLMFFGQGISL